MKQLYTKGFILGNTDPVKRILGTAVIDSELGTLNSITMDFEGFQGLFQEYDEATLQSGILNLIHVFQLTAYEIQRKNSGLGELEFNRKFFRDESSKS